MGQLAEIESTKADIGDRVEELFQGKLFELKTLGQPRSGLRHHLHQPPGPPGADGPGSEPALGMDDRGYQRRIYPKPSG